MDKTGSEGSNSRMLDQRQIFVSDAPVPRVSVLSLSVIAHVAVLVLIGIRHDTAPQIVPTKYEMVQAVSGTDQVTYNPPPKTAPPRSSPFHLPRSKRKPRTQQEQDVSGTGTALETLRAHAKAATAGLMVGIKQRLIYGFSTNDYKLAVQTAGAIPVISADELPPRFEQYLIVEVTIDTDGRVADARLLSGMATPKIEQTLLSAIREFKYIPAKRDGTPIPCQVDIVIHIPS
jgi:TonB family protein